MVADNSAVVVLFLFAGVFCVKYVLWLLLSSLSSKSPKLTFPRDRLVGRLQDRTGSFSRCEATFCRDDDIGAMHDDTDAIAQWVIRDPSLLGNEDDPTLEMLRPSDLERVKAEIPDCYD